MDSTAWPGAVDVRVVPNRGRDIAPKLVTFRPEHQSYDYVLHVHTKGSIPGWREHLLTHVLGSSEIVADIIDRFEEAPSLGIVAPDHFPPIRSWIDWGANKPTADALAARMGFDLSRVTSLDFPSGSMFWARPDALRPILDLGLTLDEFPEEAGQVDGTVAHAIERLYYIAAEAAGFGHL